ncbi:MAG: glycerol-3-phosphate acyltransferase [Chloroflexi bacterium]|nr:glycerol-3-phosphate acyltransferase [Chloroflexota bacterium]
MPWFIFVLLGYLLGSIPTAYIAGRLVKGIDIRVVGNGNMGAANAFSQLGRRIGVMVGMADACKGALAVLIAKVSGAPQVAVFLVGTAVVAGHNWPVFLGFKGGRGEATTIGVLLTLLTLPMAILAAPALATLLIRKNVIVTSWVLFVPLPLVSWLLGVPAPLIGYGVALPSLVGVTHFLRTRRAAHVSDAGSA